MGLLLFVPFMTIIMIQFQQAKALEIDFSRRTKKTQDTKPEIQTSQEKQKSQVGDFVSKVNRQRDWGNVDRQEIVILNTSKGFVPSNLRLRKGMHYLIHVVNVNKDSKNVSFMLDAFNQHHSTFYGETKTFKVDPDKEGLYEYQCPETSAAGKLVVYGPQSGPLAKDRLPAASGSDGE